MVQVVSVTVVTWSTIAVRRGVACLGLSGESATTETVAHHGGNLALTAAGSRWRTPICISVREAVTLGAPIGSGHRSLAPKGMTGAPPPGKRLARRRNSFSG